VLDDGAGLPGHPAPGDGPAPAPGHGSYGSGQGITGMAERARIYAGTVEAGRSGRGWRVHAVLTWPGDDVSESLRPYEVQGKA